jgi:hypothetical protein
MINWKDYTPEIIRVIPGSVVRSYYQEITKGTAKAMIPVPTKAGQVDKGYIKIQKAS